MIPTGLHDAKPLVLYKVGDGLLEEIRIGDEVCVKDGDELPCGMCECVFECACFVAVLMGAVYEADVETDCVSGFYQMVCLGSGVVCGVVYDLDLELVARVVKGERGLDETADDIPFVIDGELDGDGGELVGGDGGGGGRVVAGFPVIEEGDQTEESVKRHSDEDGGIGDEEKLGHLFGG